MTEPEFPEPEDFANGHRDVFGNGTPRNDPASPSENNILDIRIVQKDRSSSSKGYSFVTFDEYGNRSAVQATPDKGHSGVG